MIKIFKSFLSKLILCSALFAFAGPLSAMCAENTPQTETTTTNWTNAGNQVLFNNNISGDMNAFQSNFQKQSLTDNYIPIEAKVGYALIGSMSNLSTVLENSLIPFINIFLIMLFIFWVFFETYQMIKSDQNVKKLAEEIVKKLVLIIIWIGVIHFGPAKLFMFLMGPILQIGSYLSDLILNSVSSVIGLSLPDTCAAITNYVSGNGSATHLINSEQVSNILCVSTRLSGFFYTGIKAGFSWMSYGIGHSAFTFAVGLTFVILFIYNIYKFALMALGVIVDLFLVLIMLPFTALSECFGNTPTNYKGYAGEIFNKFMELFKNTQSLNSQIVKFINVAIYFVSLSIVIALCAAIMSGIMNINMVNNIPSVSNNSFISVLIGGILVSYLARQADTIAKKIGGDIEKGFGDKLGGDIKSLWGKTKGGTKNLWKIIRKK